MCIIVIKNVGKKWPTQKTIAQCVQSNPDGFAIAWAEKGKKPNVFKTLEAKKFLAQYKIICKLPKSTSAVIHCRIKTHGTQVVENCHCWESNKIIFAHNGILSVKARENMTDSETYFRDIFIPAYRYGGWHAAEKTIKAIIGTSKFAFMEANGKIKTYGEYINDAGILYSNTSYKPYINKFAAYYSASAFKPNRYGDYEACRASDGKPIYYSLKYKSYYRIKNGKTYLYENYTMALKDRLGVEINTSKKLPFYADCEL